MIPFFWQCAVSLTGNKPSESEIWARASAFDSRSHKAWPELSSICLSYWLLLRVRVLDLSGSRVWPVVACNLCSCLAPKLIDFDSVPGLRRMHRMLDVGCRTSTRLEAHLLTCWIAIATAHIKQCQFAEKMVLTKLLSTVLGA